MSATASTVSERRVGSDLYLPWLVVAAGCTGLMWSWPGDETIPYHVAWAAFALLYGLGDWPLRRAVTGLTLFTAVTGAVLVARAAPASSPGRRRRRSR